MVRRTTAFSKMYLVDSIGSSSSNDCCTCDNDRNLQSIHIPNENKYYKVNSSPKIPTEVKIISSEEPMNSSTVTKDSSTATENVNFANQNNSLLPQLETQTMSGDTSQSQIRTNPVVSIGMNNTNIDAVNNQRNYQSSNDQSIIPSISRDLVPSRTKQNRNRVTPYNVNSNIKKVSHSIPPSLQHSPELIQLPSQEVLPTIESTKLITPNHTGSRRYQIQIENNRRNRHQLALPYPPTNADRSIARKSTNRPIIGLSQQQPALQMDTETMPALTHSVSNKSEMDLSQQQQQQQPALEMETETLPALTHSVSNKRKTPPTTSEKSVVRKSINRPTQYQNYNMTRPTNTERLALTHSQADNRTEAPARLALTYSPSKTISIPRTSSRIAAQAANYQNYLASQQTDSEKEDVMIRYVCQICNTPFKTYKKLLKHRKSHNEIEQKERGSKRKDDQQNYFKLKQLKN